METKIINSKNFEIVCEQFLSIFPPQNIENAYENFSWGKASTPQEAVATRKNAASNFSSWVTDGCPRETAIHKIEEVHKWGFNGQGLDKRQVILFEEPYLSNFISMIQVWNEANDTAKMQDTLSTCLQTPYVKIARFSKWICFINQEKFAIYDSRVSLALRQIKLENSRVFPTLGAKSAGRPNADFISANKMVAADRIAKIYMLYTNMLRAVLPHYNLSSVAKLEMALFMLGTDKSYW